MKLGVQGAPVCRLFSLEELKEATNNFDSSMFMGEGSTGKVSSKLKNLSILDDFVWLVKVKSDLRSIISQW